MLTLPIKKKWFDMITTGDKLEEYRKITPYYETRFKNLFGELDDEGNRVLNEESTRNHRNIKLRNGYASNSPHVIVEATLKEDFGVREWGANPLELYYVLKIHKILKIQFDENHILYLCDGEGCKSKCHGKNNFCKFTSDFEHSIWRQKLEGG